MVGVLALSPSVVPVFAQNPVETLTAAQFAATLSARQTESAQGAAQWSASQTDTALRQSAESARQTASAVDSNVRSANASATSVAASATSQFLGLQRDRATATASAENIHATETRRADFATATAIANTSATAMSFQRTVTSDSATRVAERTAVADAANAQATVTANNAALALEERSQTIRSLSLAAGIILMFALIGTGVVIGIVRHGKSKVIHVEPTSVSDGEFTQVDPAIPTEQDENEIRKRVLESMQTDPPPIVILDDEVSRVIERIFENEPTSAE